MEKQDQREEQKKECYKDEKLRLERGVQERILQGWRTRIRKEQKKKYYKDGELGFERGEKKKEYYQDGEQGLERGEQKKEYYQDGELGLERRVVERILQEWRTRIRERS